MSLEQRTSRPRPPAAATAPAPPPLTFAARRGHAGGCRRCGRDNPEREGQVAPDGGHGRPGGRGRRAPSGSAAAARASARSLALPYTRRPGAHTGAHAGSQRTRGHPRPPPSPPPPRAGAGPSRRRANQHRSGGRGAHGARTTDTGAVDSAAARAHARTHPPAPSGAVRARHPKSARVLRATAPGATVRTTPRHRDTQTHRGSPPPHSLLHS